SILMRNSIMTEKIARRGVRTPEEYHADVLDQVLVRDAATPEVVTIRSSDTVAQVRGWLEQNGEEMSHQGFPVVDDNGVLVGLITRRDLRRPALTGAETISAALAGLVRFVYDDSTVRQAADHMVNHSIGRLPVVRREQPQRLVGILTRSDVLAVYQRRIRETELQRPTIALPGGRRDRRTSTDRS